ncbi:Protein-tyrosine phosphatase [Trichostrongylus colubriformis]|uniref:protein-tyrosine-phosphatase n=1 Tax=Trichostrongylus colubriformis TaxID=6319 RepID=A0AAN8FXB9_TRICO
MSTSLSEGYEQTQRGGTRAWEETFMKMHADSYREVEGRGLTTKIAKNLLNMERNRYVDVLPFDQCRIKLGSSTDEDESYINASPVSIKEAHRNYILAQGPLENTCNDFWQMVWEQKVPAVIMLNKVMESGRHKCALYFPSKNERKVEFDDFTAELENEKQHHNFVVRWIYLKRKDEGDASRRKILHVQYTEWPDFGVPASTKCFLDMLAYIKGQNVLSVSDDDPPCVVHCSAGIGRSGTFIIVDGVLRMIELGMAESDISLNKLLVDLRCQRFGLIQTPQQLMFSWHAIVDALPPKKNSGSSNTSDKSSSNGTDSDPTSLTDRKNKRKADEKEDSSTDDRMAKRREMVARMVARSRESEAARQSLVGNLANNMGISVRAVSSFGAKPSIFGSTATTTTTTNPNAEDIAVEGSPDDTVQVLRFSPNPNEKPLLAAGSWDGVVRVWMVNDNGQCEGKAQQNIPAPILDLSWTDDGTKIFIAAGDKEVRLWDLASNQVAVVGTHDGPVKTCHWIKGNNYSCLMTGSWDKTLRFWDMRQLPTQSSLANITHRCVSIFKDKTNSMPCGFAVGSIEGQFSIEVGRDLEVVLEYITWRLQIPRITSHSNAIDQRKL